MGKLYLIGDDMSDEANTAPPAPPKTTVDRYADFLNNQKESDFVGRSGGPVSKDNLAIDTGKVKK